MKIKSKKILYIITKSVWAGAGKYTHDLATNLPKEAFDVFVAAGPVELANARHGVKGHGTMAQKIKAQALPYFEIKNFKRDFSPFKDILSFFEILSLLFKIRPHIIHVSSSKAGGIAGVASFFYTLLFFWKRTLKIFTVHGWAFAEPRPRWQKKIIKFFSKATCVFYKKIICVSEFDKKIAIKNKIAKEKKLTTIHNGINSEDYNFLTKEKAREGLIKNLPAGRQSYKLKIKNSDPWIGTIGEFTKNKGQRYLIEALKELLKKTPPQDSYAGGQGKNIKLFIIGFGKIKKKLEKIIKENKLEKKVFLIENLKNAADYLKAFDVFVLPSLKEGFPYVLLEAGLARLPVVATHVGGVSEIVSNREAGLVVESGSPLKIARAVEKILESKKLKSDFSYALWERVNRDFNFQKMLDSTLMAYQNNSKN